MRTPADRDQASAVVSALAADAGVWGVRVHDVAATQAVPGPLVGMARWEEHDAARQIMLTGLRATGHHGVLEHERRDGQDFVVDVVVHDAAGRGRGIGRREPTRSTTASSLSEIVAAVERDPVDLIETVARA